jgi:hypothetical protein
MRMAITILSFAGAVGIASCQSRRRSDKRGGHERGC